MLSPFEFSLLLVQLKNKRKFSLKETLRARVNRASIGFVQERNLHVRLSLCRSIESNSTSAGRVQAPSTREYHGTPGAHFRQAFCRIRSRFFCKGYRAVAALSKEV
jgi:hypothetical protein